jgi:hypothetical protein
MYIYIINISTGAALLTWNVLENGSSKLLSLSLVDNPSKQKVIDYIVQNGGCRYYSKVRKKVMRSLRGRANHVPVL